MRHSALGRHLCDYRRPFDCPRLFDCGSLDLENWTLARSSPPPSDRPDAVIASRVRRRAAPMASVTQGRDGVDEMTRARPASLLRTATDPSDDGSFRPSKRE